MSHMTWDLQAVSLLQFASIPSAQNLRFALPLQKVL